MIDAANGLEIARIAIYASKLGKLLGWDKEQLEKYYLALLRKREELRGATPKRGAL